MIALTLSFCAFPIWAQIQDRIIKLEVFHSQHPYQAAKTYPLLLQVTIAKNWYIHADKVQGPFLFPTTFVFGEQPYLQIDRLRFPQAEARKFAYSNEVLDLFSGTIQVLADLKIKPGAPEGDYPIKGRLTYQACTTKSCTPIEERPFEVMVTVAAPDKPVQDLNAELFAAAQKPALSFKIGFWIMGSGFGFWMTLLLLFLGGMALNLTPCVYPLIPITVSYFGGKGPTLRRNRILHGLCYLLGLSLVNSLLGLTAALTGSLLGALLQNPLVLSGIALVMVLMALSFFGLWEMRLPAWLTRPAAKQYRGYGGAFFMGLTLGVLATPCLGPLILGLLTHVAQLGDPWRGFLYFFVLSLGLGLPLTILAVFAGLIEKLPLSGDWMIWVRKLFGWVLIAMAFYYINMIIPWDLDETLFFAGAAAAAGIHLGWLEPCGKGSFKFKRFKKAAGLALIAGGIVYFALSTQIGRPGVDWKPYTPDLMTKSLQEKRPVILEFTARFCSPCRIMDKRIFHNAEVVAFSRDFVMLKMDLTYTHPLQKQAMEQYGVRGIPSILFFNPQGREEKDLRVEELVSKADFLQRMKRLQERAKTGK